MSYKQHITNIKKAIYKSGLDGMCPYFDISLPDEERPEEWKYSAHATVACCPCLMVCLPASHLLCAIDTCMGLPFLPCYNKFKTQDMGSVLPFPMASRMCHEILLHKCSDEKTPIRQHMN